MTIIQFIKSAWVLPQTAAAGFRQWRRQTRLVESEAEAERLDRIRHPSKYLGR